MRLLVSLLAVVAIVAALMVARPGSESGPSSPAAAQQTVDQQRDAVDGINRAIQAREAAQ